jgi:peptide-methionine (S)-S-oxide reductase
MSDLEQATVGGGCFWCVEAALDRLEGVHDTTSGYAGGHVEDPSYRAVCTGETGHAEVVQVTYDPSVLDYRTLLEVFFTIHDPTQEDRQGADVGPQYRSIVLAHDEEQEQVAREVVDDLEGDVWTGIVTEVEPLERFWEAEEKHQDYYEKNPDQGYCRAVIEPKLSKLRAKWGKRVEGA